MGKRRSRRRRRMDKTLHLQKLLQDATEIEPPFLKTR
jgi:hypothetical protein